MAASPHKSSHKPQYNQNVGSETNTTYPPTFAQQLFLGRFDEEQLMPYYEQPAGAVEAGRSMVDKVKGYCLQYVFPDRIDQHSLLAPGVTKGMGNLGVLGMLPPKELGGTGMTVFNFCRVMETIGGHCGSTATMVRLQSSVVLNLLQSYGTPAQQKKWMPPIIAGDKTGALVVTEELAGSDISNVHATATPNESGNGFKLKGEKRWIANGANADLLIVLARTPDGYGPAGSVSAFLVAADAPGVTINPITKSKLGLKGISVAAIDLENVAVSQDDLIGSAGDGVGVVESIVTLDRIVYAATTVGLIQTLLEMMVKHASTRTQFGKTLGHFEQVKQKIASVASNLYALRATLYHVASQYDCDGSENERVIVESQILKLFASESAWEAVNQAVDLCGGKSVFNDQPLERILRDVRHALVAEGSNDLLRQQIAANRTLAHHSNTDHAKTTSWLTAASNILPTSPTIEVKHEHLRFHARWIANHVAKFGRVCNSNAAILKPATTNAATAETSELTLQRIADLETRLFLSSCVFAKLSALMVNGTIPEPDKRFEFDTGALFLQQAKRANQASLDQLKINLDAEFATVADHWLDHEFDD